jgi:hypothetical protein
VRFGRLTNVVSVLAATHVGFTFFPDSENERRYRSLRISRIEWIEVI